MDYGLRYFISKDNSDWLELSDIINSKNTTVQKSLCTNGFKSAVDTATFTLKGNTGNAGQVIREEAYGMLMDSLEGSTTVYVKIERNEELFFQGIIDLSSFSVASTKVEGDITLSCRDLSALHLDDVVDKHLFYENKSISQIVIELLGEAGYSGGRNQMMASDDVTIPAFVVDADENTDTYRDIIDTLLFEAGGYVLKMDRDGIFDILIIQSTAPEKQPEGIDYAISSGLSSKASMLDNDGLDVEWATLDETDSSQSVYVDSSISRSVDENNNIIGLEVSADGYFPEDGDITASYQEFDAKLLDREYNTGVSRKENKDITIICVRDVTAEIIAADVNGNTVDNDEAWDYPILPSLGMEKNPTIWPLKAWYLLRNKYGSKLNLQHFTLHGRVLYRNKVYHSIVPAAAKKPEEYTSTYIFTKEHAERFAKFYWHFKKYSRVVHTWVEYEYSAREEGDLVTINHKGTSAGQPSIIVQRNISFEDGKAKTSYTALSIGSYDEYEIKNWGSSPNYNVDKPADPLVPRRQYAIFSSPNVSDIFTTAIIYTDAKGSSWFLVDDAALISEALSDADWSPDYPTVVPEGQYLYCREWNYEMGQWDYYRLTGSEGAPVRDFTVTSSPVTYFNSKRRKGPFVITIEVSTSNLSETAQIDYSLKTSGVSLSNNAITIPEGVYPASISVEVIVTDLDTKYGPVTKTLLIKGQDAEDSRPIYLGAYSSDPSPDAFSYNLVEGDYYWNTESLLAMRYSINNEGEFYWRAAENGDPNFSAIMSTVTADAFSNIEPGSVTLSQFGYFENIIAEYIKADMIEAMTITLRGGGSVKSEGYNKGDIDLATAKTGFYFDCFGYAEFQNLKTRGLKATDAEVTGLTAVNAMITGLKAVDAEISGELNSKNLSTMDILEISVSDVKEEDKSAYSIATSLKSAGDMNVIQSYPNKYSYFEDGGCLPLFDSDGDLEYLIFYGTNGGYTKMKYDKATGTATALSETYQSPDTDLKQQDILDAKPGPARNFFYFITNARFVFLFRNDGFDTGFSPAIDFGYKINIESQGALKCAAEENGILYLISPGELFKITPHGDGQGGYGLNNDCLQKVTLPSELGNARFIFCCDGDIIVFATSSSGNYEYVIYDTNLSLVGEKKSIEIDDGSRLCMHDSYLVSLEDTIGTRAVKKYQYVQLSKSFTLVASDTVGDSNYIGILAPGIYMPQGYYSGGVFWFPPGIVENSIFPAHAPVNGLSFKNGECIYYSGFKNDSGDYTFKYDHCSYFYDNKLFLLISKLDSTLVMGYCNMENTAGLCDQFTNLKDMLTDPSKYKYPALNYGADVTGKFYIADEEEKSLSFMMISRDTIILEDSSGERYEYSSSNPPLGELRIDDLVIGTTHAIRTSSIMPDSQDVNIGAEGNRFNQIFANQVWGAVFN